MLDNIDFDIESLMPVLCAKVYSIAYKRLDHEFQPYSQVLDTAERRMSEPKIFVSKHTD
jgi:hypothetical protein